MKKIFKRLLWIGLILVILVAGGTIAGHYFLKKYIEDKLADINQKSAYDLTYQDLDLNLIPLSATLKQVNFCSKHTTSSAVVYRASLEAIKIKGLTWIKLLSEKEGLEIGRISLIKPQLQLDYSQKSKDSSQSSQNSIPDKLVPIKLKTLYIEEGSIQIKRDTQLLGQTNLNLELHKLTVNPKDSGLTYKVFDVERVDLQLRDLSYKISNGLYKLQISEVNLQKNDQHKGNLEVDLVQIIPLINRYQLAELYGHEVTWFYFNTNHISIHDLDFPKILDSTFLAQSLSINSFKAEVFLDKRWPFPAKPDTKLPQSIINGLPYAIKIDTFLVKNSYVGYDEIAPTANEPGRIFFSNINLQGYDIKNKNVAQAGGYNLLYAKALLYGTSPMDVRFHFPVIETSLYRTEGSISNVPMQKLNAMFEPSENVRIQSGHIDNLTFDFSYNHYHSNGQAKIRYRNLDVVLLKKEQGNKPKKEEKKERSGVGKVIHHIFGSDKKKKNNKIDQLSEKLQTTQVAKTALINMILKKDSKKNGEYQAFTGQIDIDRNRKKSVFNFWWISLVDGLKSAVVPETVTKIAEELKGSKKKKD